MLVKRTMRHFSGLSYEVETGGNGSGSSSSSAMTHDTVLFLKLFCFFASVFDRTFPCAKKNGHNKGKQICPPEERSVVVMNERTLVGAEILFL